MIQMLIGIYLDVAVHDFTGMHVRDGFQQLPDDGAHQAMRQALGSVGPQLIHQRAWHILLNQVYLHNVTNRGRS